MQKVNICIDKTLFFCVYLAIKIKIHCNYVACGKNYSVFFYFAMLNLSLSLIIAMNSEFVGLPRVLCIV